MSRDPIAAMFRGKWVMRPADPGNPRDVGSELAVLHVMVVQAAWRALTQTSRQALVAAAEDPAAVMHHSTRRALVAHGLLCDTGVTESGRQVVRYRPLVDVPEEA